MFKKLLLIFCFSVSSAFFYGCPQQPQPGDEEAVVEEETVEEVVVPTEAPTPTDESTDTETN